MRVGVTSRTSTRNGDGRAGRVDGSGPPRVGTASNVALLLARVKRRDHREDDFAVLDGSHVAGRERTTVAVAIDVEDHRAVDAPGPQEVAVQRVRQPLGRHRRARGARAPAPRPGRRRATCARPRPPRSRRGRGHGRGPRGRAGRRARASAQVSLGRLHAHSRSVTLASRLRRRLWCPALSVVILADSAVPDRPWRIDDGTDRKARRAPLSAPYGGPLVNARDLLDPEFAPLVVTLSRSRVVRSHYGHPWNSLSVAAALGRRRALRAFRARKSAGAGCG